MIRPRTISLAIAALVLGAGAVLSGCSTLSGTAVSVNGSSLSNKEFTDRLDALAKDPGYLAVFFSASGQCQASSVYGSNKQNYSTAFTTQVLDQQIAFDVAHQEVERRHLSVTASDLSAVKTQFVSSVTQQCPSVTDGAAVLTKLGKYENVLLRGYADEVALEHDFETKLNTDAGLRGLYDKTKSEYKDMACVSLIDVETKPAATQDSSGNIVSAPASAFAAALTKAQALETQIANGASFESVAKSSSNDPTSAAKGGAIGCVKKGSLSSSGFPGLDTAAFGQAVGEVGAPVKTTLGYAIVKVTSRGDLTFEQAKSLVQQSVSTTAQNLFADYLTTASRKADVAVDPQWGSWNQKLGYVVPPVGATTTTGHTTILPAGLGSTSSTTP